MATTTADYRDTGFEIHTVHQEANGLRVVFSDRNAPPDLVGDPGSPTNARLQAKQIPELFILHERFSEQQLATVVAAWTAIEQVGREIFRECLAREQSAR